MQIYWLGFLLLSLIIWGYHFWYRGVRAWFVLGFLVIAITGSGLDEASWQYTDYKSNVLAHEIAGPKAGHLHCQRLTETLAFAGAQAADVVQDPTSGKFSGMLTYDVCKDLRMYLYNKKVNVKATTAIHIIDHESIHLTGIFSESATECYSMKWDEKSAVLLGANPTDAKKLALIYKTQVYPHMQPPYNGGKC
jgi:hypothetical protein